MHSGVAGGDIVMQMTHKPQTYFSAPCLPLYVTDAKNNNNRTI